MRFEVVVPWRAGCRHREAAFRYLASRLDVRAVDANPAAPFNRAATRNLAVESSDADVVIIHDADMLAPLDAYPVMAELAAESGRMVVGFTEYRALSRSDTHRVYDGTDPFTVKPAAVLDGWSVGGIIAISRLAWRYVGGMDSRFEGWSCEDTAFAHAASVILGPFLRAENPAVHFWHPHGTDITPQAQIEANGRLLAAYTACKTIEEIRGVQCGSCA